MGWDRTWHVKIRYDTTYDTIRYDMMLYDGWHDTWYDIIYVHHIANATGVTCMNAFAWDPPFKKQSFHIKVIITTNHPSCNTYIDKNISINTAVLIQSVVLDGTENFTVIISDQKWPVTYDQLNGSSFTKCGQYPGIPPGGEIVIVRCAPPGIVGRYVYIHQLVSKQTMNLCEVEVFDGK